MKRKITKGKYKFQGGVQRIENDTPPYDSAYAIREQANAKNQIGQNIGATAANIAMPGLGSALQGVGAISDAAFKDAKGNYKNKFSEVANTYTNPLATAGKAVSALTGDKTAAADLFSGLGVTAGLQALGVKNPFGKTTQEKVKEEAMKQEEITKMANINKRYSEGTATDAQAALAKRGKYKVKTKEPRLIETEGREPIFSPKKADGTRDLLYYNPNDPTHEEGGVKAVVMPRAQAGKQKLKAKPKYIQDKDSWSENLVEPFDISGLSSWDDAYRSLKNLKNNPGNKEQFAETLLETFGALPVVGKAKYLPKIARSLKAAKAAGRTYDAKNIFLDGILRDEGYNKKKGTYKGRNIVPEYYTPETVGMGAPAFKQGTSNLMPKRSKVSLLGSGNIAVGAKQIKVDDLNSAAFSQNLVGSTPANAANKFVQPRAGLHQVARQIPEERRKEKIRTPRSHKKENPDTNRIIDPPMLYEMKPPPPRSTFNTKNDFNKGSKRVKVYR
jgi:hypothetical protein